MDRASRHAKQQHLVFIYMSEQLSVRYDMKPAKKSSTRSVQIAGVYLNARLLLSKNHLFFCLACT